ncbi:hypothetical protein FB567DRAFT_437000 [Paraphoma chrysanthemicola]|uniref:F-box domain-containing protein n=1 Tax=Paraphoma chrysanthemicola TaxID=798071 RepID=A0A8K0RCS4_9PLEO|nr:hypothetical protein FB567DRAFT_437000 [Paraphoma chrysanthemicola]
MASVGTKRPHSDLAGSTAQPRKRPARVKSSKGQSEEDSTEHPASTFRTPTNPFATLSNLPAELRLQIYSHLCDTTIIHVHRHGAEYGKNSKFTWTPCRAPSSASPLLCANPKWSGMCDEEDRCTYKIYAPPEPIGFWGLAASNKMIRNETQEFFLRKSVVSIHPRDLRPWLDHLADKDPKRCQDSIYRWTPFANRSNFQFDGEAWKRWHIVDWMKSFSPSVTIAIEAIVWKKSHPRWTPNIVEQQVAVRLIRQGEPTEEGSRSASGWADEDVDVQIVKPGKLASPKRNAKWRQWWRGKEMKGFA